MAAFAPSPSPSAAQADIADRLGAVKALGYAVAGCLLLVLGSVAGKITALGIRMFNARPSSETDQKG